MIDNQRQIDLIRYCRAHLHDENLISNEEYAWLLTEENPGAVSRLEQYDALRARIAELEKPDESHEYALAVIRRILGTNDVAGIADGIDQVAQALESARAGEARAVEALKHVVEMAYAETSSESSEGRLMRFCYAARDTAERVIDSAQPALDWIDQQRREAAAEELESAAEHCETTELLMPVPSPGTTLRQHGANVCVALAGELRDRAAALRAGEVRDDTRN